MTALVRNYIKHAVIISFNKTEINNQLKAFLILLFVKFLQKSAIKWIKVIIVITMS